MSTSKRFLAKNGLDNNNNTITNTADPVNAQDVATKAFSSNASNLTSGTIGPGVTIAAITQIINGTSNVNISTSGGDITVTRAGSLQATFASGGLTVNNNTTISNSSARLYVDATGGSDPQVQFLRSSSLNALVGVSSGANNIIVGSTAGDMCLRVVTNDLLISTDNGSTATLIVDSSGNVGVGVAAAAKLHVRKVSNTGVEIARFENINVASTDTAYLKISADNVNNLISYDSTGNVSGTHAWLSGGGEVMRMTGTGLGIGTSPNASALLHLKSASTAANLYIDAFTGSDSIIRILNNGVEKSTIRGDESSNLKFETSGTERVRIGSGGKVTIGSTNTSEAQLRIDSSSTSVPVLLLNNRYIYTWSGNKPGSTAVTITFTTDSYFSGKLTFNYCHTNVGTGNSAFAEGYFSYNSSIGSWIETLSNNLSSTSAGTITFVVNDTNKTLTITIPAGNASNGFYSFSMDGCVALASVVIA